MLTDHKMMMPNCRHFVLCPLFTDSVKRSVMLNFLDKFVAGDVVLVSTFRETMVKVCDDENLTKELSASSDLFVKVYLSFHDISDRDETIAFVGDYWHEK